ncbi:TPA: hypothetical protein N0F65_007084 [Lagenidium giganteum]|uniref:Anaphase-promoting complex subunit 4 WD40 domain-containing protein n=1 Tax=Lagenidium giganteum TaxID=4803 RepID=A0AAV2YTX8_9STRA|nr:TPA: hypothetical protein N0F65_007084 [Lagenidium giganteum]
MTAMAAEADIAAPIKVQQGLVQWSPCGQFIAVAHNNRLAVRDARTLQILQQYSTIDVIQSIAWSDDSELVSTAMYKRSVVQVWSVKDASWSCKINEGLAGMIFARWAPDSRHFVTVSDFQLHATVWSLTDCSKYVIRNPKLGAEGFTFSADGAFLAVAERHECKDFLGVYDCASWELAVHFPVDSYDCTEIVFSPDNTTLAIRDTLLEFRVLFYSIDGKLLAKYQAYENALGLKSMAWSSSGQFIALGSYDDHLRVLSHLNWKPMVELDHTTIATKLGRSNQHAVEYEEHYADEPVIDRPHGKRIPISQRSVTSSASAVSAAQKAAGRKQHRDICFVVREPPFSVLTVPSDPLRENPKLGISRVLWSPDSAFLATKSDQMPHNVWIWDTSTMTLHSVVALIRPVRSFRWDPVNNRLAVCSGDHRVYLWSVEGVSWIDLPSVDFKVLLLRWHPQGTGLITVARQEFCCISL